jgi:hypothetical protein
MAKYAQPYTTFAGYVQALRKLGNTMATWEELSEEEQVEIYEISAQISNSMGELEKINPKRWSDPQKQV